MTLESLWPYIFIAVAGWLATDMWRWLGVAFATRIKETSEIFIWVKVVATALMASVVAHLIFMPAEPLADFPLGLRIGAAAIGFAAFWMAQRNIFFGVLAAEAAFIIGGASYEALNILLSPEAYTWFIPIVR